MVRNMYFRNVYKRTNVVKEGLLGLFLGISSWPRLLLEVWVRRNLGSRYFSFSGSVVIAVLLTVYPVISAIGRNALSSYGYGHQVGMGDFIAHYLTWYAFVIGFMYMANERHQESATITAQFDMNHFSLSTGLVHPFFSGFRINGNHADIRTVETLIEPAFFFVAGIVLSAIGQAIGPVITICALIYGLSYQAQYYLSDEEIRNKIDEMIASRNFIAAFVDGKDASETDGFRVDGRRPADPDFRRELADTFLSKEEVFVAA